ncbi:hypothetical protein A2841_04050 [Candidatus Kaiserbacteria bacterium RIFCSPHIGHO2_01_FULL_48_10]|uniref:DUF192 domain-containing protein n=1 Tax=Candidatus Kaiserbacteria bacterium RIFCSPHIGHO2_01_FULL_48_10 TaxID=1798476 RepID=A0A1F6C484_9BACT|nr:MAG: hypothetical protein A2841_04050 [Candidatus Kaiserbacteria bacterium RIFCSPHIGHO2_01_FULL_48_10]
MLIGSAALAALLALWFMPIQKLTPHTTVIVGGVPVSVEVVATDASRRQGLSGRENLPKGEGMLFVFDAPGRYPFWMKDTQFPIDILWLDANGVIVYVEKEVSPATYPKQFIPTQDALYVLEVSAGFIEQHNLIQGSKVNIPPDVL